MSESSHRNLLLRALKGVVVAIIKLIFLVIAWILKIAGLTLVKSAELIFKLSEK